jgi:hypothetical protein
MMTTLHDRFESIRNAPYDGTVAGDLYQLKMEALSASLPLEAAKAFAEALGNAAHAQILAFRSLYAYARDRNAIVATPHPGGKGEINMPSVRGEERQPAHAVLHRPVAVICLENAWVTGRSGMIRVDDTLLADYHDEELAAWPTDFRMDPIPFDQSSDSVAALIGPEDGSPLEEAISLVGFTSYNFGHWIVEYLLRFSMLQSQDLTAAVPILIDARIASTQREALEIFSRGRRPIIEVNALATRFVRRLWVPTNLFYVPIMPRPGVAITLDYISPHSSYAAQLYRNMSNSIAYQKGTPKRIYLARKMSLHRKLLNQEEIIGTVKAVGFEVFYLENHEFNFQISLIRNAEVIIGPEGSQMLVAVYARPGTRILILNHPFLENLPSLTHILEELGMHAEILPGTCVRLDEVYRKMSDYTISPRTVSDVLAEWGCASLPEQSSSETHQHSSNRMGTDEFPPSVLARK